MPEKYYGMALKMEGKTQAELDAAAARAAIPVPVPKPIAPAGPLPHRPIWPFVTLIVAVLFLIGGGFVWFNRDAFFPKPVPVVVEPPPEVKPAPNAPANLVAIVSTGTVPAVNLSWRSGGGEVAGFRLDRREGEGTFLPLTNLTANANQFLDPTVRNGQKYEYRVIAVGPGGESSPSSIALVRVEEFAVVPPGQSLPPGGLDLDSDGISDVEEAVFGTDSRVPDTDRDGFLDGNETFHLYNPAAKAPVRLLDSGLVSIFSGSAGWSIYVPKGFTTSLDKSDGSAATIRTNQGETFHISVEDTKNPEAQIPITTKGGLEGFLSPDRLSAYFPWDAKVFVLRYDTGEKPYINFRTTYEMMLNSLQLSGVPVLSVADAVLGGPGEFLQTTSTTP